jgi:hypothetical protein
METVTLKDGLAQAVSPEGQTASMKIADLLKTLADRQIDAGDFLLPDNVKAMLVRGKHMIWVHQTPPRVYQFNWIAGDSPSPFGRGTRYRPVTIALPYLVVLAVFAPAELGQVQLTHLNECFFRNSPLSSLDDELYFPALLNCSKYHPPEGRPLSWICTQHLDRSKFLAEPNANRRLRAGLRALLHCLLETAFNLSSEHHEQSSWFTQSLKVDARIGTIEKWQAASAKDPLFVLEVPWLKTGLSVRQVAERIFKNQKAAAPSPATASDVARVLFNQNPSGPPV